MVASRADKTEQAANESADASKQRMCSVWTHGVMHVLTEHCMQTSQVRHLRTRLYMGKLDEFITYTPVYTEGEETYITYTPVYTEGEETYITYTPVYTEGEGKHTATLLPTFTSTVSAGPLRASQRQGCEGLSRHHA